MGRFLVFLVARDSAGEGWKGRNSSASYQSRASSAVVASRRGPGNGTRARDPKRSMGAGHRPMRRPLAKCEWGWSPWRASRGSPN